MYDLSPTRSLDPPLHGARTEEDMKPVVTSLVALALAIAPLAAWAAPGTSPSHEAKPAAAKVVKHAAKKGGKVAKH